MKKGSHLGLGCIVIGREEGKRKPSLPKYGCCQSCPYLGKGAGSGSQNSGSGSKNVKFLLGEENLPERVCYKRERGPGPSVTAGVPIFFLCHTIKANVTWILLAIHGPIVPAILGRIGSLREAERRSGGALVVVWGGLVVVAMLRWPRRSQ